jgi:hypothetical protein
MSFGSINSPIKSKIQEDTIENFFTFFTFGFAKKAADLLNRKRSEMFNIFLNEIGPKADESILDVGVTVSDFPAANYLESNYSQPRNITALSLENPAQLKKIYPDICFVQGNGKALDFPDRSFDVVYSHAVIEHTGNRHEQQKFLSELVRVARRAVFFTTPNGSHPLELHTGLPILHYLPKVAHRWILSKIGQQFYSREDNLNLLNKSTIKMLLQNLAIRNYRVRTIKLLGISSNILVIIER